MEGRPDIVLLMIMVRSGETVTVFQTMRKYFSGICVRSVVGGEFVHIPLDLYICYFWKETLVRGKSQYSFAAVPNWCVPYQRNTSDSCH